MGRIGYFRMPKLVRFLTGALACSTAAVVLASTASATITTGNLIEPHSTKYVSDGDYGVRSDNFGSLTWLDNKGERGFRITRSTADSSRVTAYPNIFRGWQWGVGTSGNWPVRVSDDNMPRADFAVHQTWKGTYDASLDLWFSTYPNTTTQANGAEIMIWLSHPHVLAGGKKIRVDGTDWYMNEWKTKGHGLTWPLIIFTHATPISSVKHLWLNPFFRIAEAHGWLKPSWYWTGIDAGFELWKGGQGLQVTDFSVDS
jgi:Glycosyl hydrolase family 12